MVGLARVRKDIRKDDRGTFTVWALCLCLIIFVLAGISVDVWRAFEARRSLHEIADTAARAGASEINVFERQYNSVTILEPNLAYSSTVDSILENSSLNNIEIDTYDIEVIGNEVNVEVTSTFSFFLLRFLPDAQDIDMVSFSSASPFEG